MSASDKQLFRIRTATDRQMAASVILELEDGKDWHLTISQKPPKRTLLQNDLYWAYMTDLGNQTGYTKEEMSLIAKSELLEPKLVEFNGRPKLLTKSTTDLSVKEMSDYIRSIEIWAAENGFTLHAPNFRDEAIR